MIESSNSLDLEKNFECFPSQLVPLIKTTNDNALKEHGSLWRLQKLNIIFSEHGRKVDYSFRITFGKKTDC